MTNQKKRAIFGVAIILAITLASISCATLLSEESAQRIRGWLTSMGIFDGLLSWALGHTAEYPDPMAAQIGMLVFAIGSPLIFFSGVYVALFAFMKSMEAAASQRSFISNMGLALAVGAIAIAGVFTVFGYFSHDTYLCRGCEQTNISFALIKNIAGLYACGAVLRVSISLITFSFKHKD